MTIRITHLLGGAASLVGLSLLGLATPSCSQPAMLCDVASGPYVARYFPKEGAGDCLSLPGELVGMKTYNPPSADGDGLDAGETEIAVQSASVGQLADDAAAAGAADPDGSHTLYSFGEYSNKPDGDDLCSAPGLSPAELHIPRTDYTDAGGDARTFPETRLVYEWKGLVVYTTFTAPGTAATGEVTITREVTDPATGTKDSCTATYVVSALSPVVGCEATDAMGNPTGLPDDEACCPEADLSKGRTSGSGIDPDFRVRCDPALLLCVLDWKPGEAFPPLGGNPGCGGSTSAPAPPPRP